MHIENKIKLNMFKKSITSSKLISTLTAWNKKLILTVFSSSVTGWKCHTCWMCLSLFSCKGRSILTVYTLKHTFLYWLACAHTHTDTVIHVHWEAWETGEVFRRDDVNSWNVAWLSWRLLALAAISKENWTNSVSEIRNAAVLCNTHEQNMCLDLSLLFSWLFILLYCTLCH